MVQPWRRTWILPALVPLAVLAACSEKPDFATPDETEIPDALTKFEPPRSAQNTRLGTPLEERVATLGLLNKRNNLTQDIEMKPGEARRVGDVIVRLASCERTAPWENPPETGAFVQVLIAQRSAPGTDPQWQRIFSGWLFKNSPSLNVVEHPIYDVWVKDCAMSFPGEEQPLADSPSSAANPSGTASPPSNPAPSQEPAPSPAAESAPAPAA